MLLTERIFLVARSFDPTFCLLLPGGAGSLVKAVVALLDLPLPFKDAWGRLPLVRDFHDAHCSSSARKRPPTPW